MSYFSIFFACEDWRGGVRRTAVDALARLFTGEPWVMVIGPAVVFSSYFLIQLIAKYHACD